MPIENNKFILEIEDRLNNLVQSKIGLKEFENNILLISQSLVQEMLRKRRNQDEYNELSKLHNKVLTFNSPVLEEIENEFVTKLIEDSSKIFEVKDSIEYLVKELQTEIPTDTDRKKEKLNKVLSSIEEYFIFKLSPVLNDTCQGFADQNKIKINNALKENFQQIQQVTAQYFSKESFWEEIDSYFKNNKFIELLNNSLEQKNSVKNMTLDNLNSTQDTLVDIDTKQELQTLEISPSIINSNSDQISNIKEDIPTNDPEIERLYKPYEKSMKDAIQELVTTDTPVQSDPPQKVLQVQPELEVLNNDNNVDTQTPQELTPNLTENSKTPELQKTQDVFAAEDIGDDIIALQEFTLPEEIQEKISSPQESTIPSSEQSLQQKLPLSDAFNKLRANLNNMKTQAK